MHTWGSEEDIRPFLALAAGLVRAGHEVRLVSAGAEHDSVASLTDAGYEQRQIAPPQPVAELHRIGDETLSDASPRRQLTRLMREVLEPLIDELTHSARELAKWADVLVLCERIYPLAAAAEAERKPLVCVYTGATIATREIPPPGLPDLGPLNSLTWKLWRTLLSASLVGSVNRVRERFGLAPVKRAHQQFDHSAIDLIAMSPALLRRPSHWPAKVHLTGFFNAPPLSRREKLPPALKAFLMAGPAPAYVTFGSMAGFERNPHTLIELAEAALDAAGCRAIIQSEIPAAPSSSLFRVTEATYDPVFPQCSAIIHHGSAIAAQAALHAGRPSVVVAHMTDQFTWGRRLYKLGVAPRHLSRGRLEPRQLLRAIDRATRDTAMRARAERVGEQLRQEDGVRRAVELTSLQGPR